MKQLILVLSLALMIPTATMAMQDGGNGKKWRTAR